MFAFMALAVSCTQKDNKPSDSKADYLASYSGKYMAPNDIAGWTETYSPNFSVTLILYSDKTCEISAGILEWPVNTEYDKLELYYRTTNTGLELYEEDKEFSNPIFIVSSKTIQSDLDPEKDLVNYLGYQLEMRWEKSLGKVWDKYSDIALWPKKLALVWRPSDINDVL